ncbi:MAG: hypothetical protein ABIQ88_18265 [Chitinophagaceae bacterium]
MFAGSFEKIYCFLIKIRQYPGAGYRFNGTSVRRLPDPASGRTTMPNNNTTAVP